MQTQSGFAGCLRISEAPIASVVGALYAMGDTLGIARDTVEVGAPLVLERYGQFGTDKVLEGEEWAEGARLYWDETHSVITKAETHWPAGIAGAEGKAADTLFAQVLLEAGVREPGLVMIPFDFDLLPANFAADGDYVLRDFGQDVQIVHCELISSGLLPGTASIALGNGTGSNDQIMAAQVFGDLTGYDDITAAPISETLPVTVDKAVLRLALGPATAGRLIIRMEYVPA